MFSIAQFSLLMTLIPLAAGLALVGLGSRISQRAAVGIAIGAAVIAFIAALFVAASALPDAPSLVTLFSFGKMGLVYRLDRFSAYLIIGITAWVMPVLLWMTVPRGKVAAEQQHSTRPLGWVLLAVSLALGAVLADNILVIALCWGGVGFIAWCMGRPEAAFRPSSPQEWFDLPLLTLGPILFALAMIFPMTKLKTPSIYAMTGQSPFTFASGFLVILVLFFAAGLYPFIIWVRRVAQGVLPEAVGVLLLLITPISVALLGRMLVLLSPNGVWPIWHIGPANFSLNAVALILGIATVLVAGIVLLFEQDLLVITAMLNTLVLGWGVTAIGTGDSHALVGLTLLLLVQTLAIGTLMAVWGSLEWSERDLRVSALAGFAHDMPSHFIAVTLATLTLVGVPLFAGFSAMATIDQGIISDGGTSALGGALIWIGNALALLGILRLLSRALHGQPNDESTQVAGTVETVALLIPAALLLLVGIAPELLFLGKSPIWGPTISAAAALLSSSTSIGDLAITPLGFTLGGVLWIPGIFWALGIVAAGVVAVSAGLIGTETTPSPVFVGGEPFTEPQEENTQAWFDLMPIALSPVLLPGPASWRMDLADEAEWEGDVPEEDVFVYAEEDDAEGSEADDAPEIVDTDAVIIDADADETDVKTVDDEEPIATSDTADSAIEVAPITPKTPLQPPPAQRPRPATNNTTSARQQGKGGQRGNQR